MGIGLRRENNYSADDLQKNSHPKRKRRDDYSRACSMPNHPDVRNAEEREG